jgi:hypothetical protein
VRYGIEQSAFQFFASLYSFRLACLFKRLIDLFVKPLGLSPAAIRRGRKLSDGDRDSEKNE